MWSSRWRCVIKPAYSFSFLLSINIFVWQNVLYFLDAPRINVSNEYKKEQSKPNVYIRIIFTCRNSASFAVREQNSLTLQIRKNVSQTFGNNPFSRNKVDIKYNIKEVLQKNTHTHTPKLNSPQNFRYTTRTKYYLKPWRADGCQFKERREGKLLEKESKYVTKIIW